MYVCARYASLLDATAMPPLPHPPRHSRALSRCRVFVVFVVSLYPLFLFTTVVYVYYAVRATMMRMCLCVRAHAFLLLLCVCVCVNVYECVYMYVYVCVCMYSSLYVCVSLCAAYTHMRAHTRGAVSRHVAKTACHKDARVHIRARRACTLCLLLNYVCMCMYMCVHASSSIYVYASASTHIGIMITRRCPCTDIYIHARLLVRSCAHFLLTPTSSCFLYTQAVQLC